MKIFYDPILGKFRTKDSSTSGGGSIPPVGGSIIVDAMFGDDGTGMPYSQEFPFATISAAVAVYSSGDQVYVRANSSPYTDVNVGTDGLKIHFEHGANMDSAGNCFNDAGSYGMSITGFGRFESSSSVIFGSGGYITFQGIYANGGGSGSRTIWNFGDGIIDVNLIEDLQTTGLEQVIRVDGEFSEVYVTCRKMIGTGGLIQTGGSTDSAKVEVHAFEYHYLADGAGYVGINLAKGDVKLYGGKVFIVGNGIYAAPAIWLSNVSSLYIEGDVSIVEATDGGFYNTSGPSYCEFGGRVICSNSPIRATNGRVVFRKLVQNDIAGPAVTQVGGEVDIYDFVVNIQDDATADAYMANGGIQKFRAGSGLYITNAGAECLDSASGSPTTLVYGTPVANKVISVAIVQLVSVFNVDPINVIP